VNQRATVGPNRPSRVLPMITTRRSGRSFMVGSFPSSLLMKATLGAGRVPPNPSRDRRAAENS
jgi:hypothetical protein